MSSSPSTPSEDVNVSSDSDELVEKKPETTKNIPDTYRDALQKFSKNREEDLTVFSDIPEKCRQSTCYVGIDEAGRGPVLGPMVYAIFACVADEEEIASQISAGKFLSKIEENPPVLIDRIKKLNDSKQINEKTREQIFFQDFEKLDYVSAGTKIISPAQISALSYKRQKISLNDISHNAAMELIQGLIDRGVKIGKVFVDTVGPMDKYQIKLEKRFPDLQFKVDKKADSKYKTVSAASICAKVTRDLVLKDWESSFDQRVFGSGYPGDEKTKNFLKSNIDPIFGFPTMVRDNWSTASDLLEKRAMNVKWEIEENEAPPEKISKYFVKKQSKTKENGVEKEEKPESFVKRKAQFFSYRELVQTDKLF